MDCIFNFIAGTIPEGFIVRMDAENGSASFEIFKPGDSIHAVLTDEDFLEFESHNLSQKLRGAIIMVSKDVQMDVAMRRVDAMEEVHNGH